MPREALKSATVTTALGFVVCVINNTTSEVALYLDKSRQLATRLKVSLKCQVWTGTQAYSPGKKKRSILLITLQVVTPPTT